MSAGRVAVEMSFSLHEASKATSNTDDQEPKWQWESFKRVDINLSVAMWYCTCTTPVAMWYCTCTTPVAKWDLLKNIHCHISIVLRSSTTSTLDCLQIKWRCWRPRNEINVIQCSAFLILKVRYPAISVIGFSLLLGVVIVMNSSEHTSSPYVEVVVRDVEVKLFLFDQFHICKKNKSSQKHDDTCARLHDHVVHRETDLHQRSCMNLLGLKRAAVHMCMCVAVS